MKATKEECAKRVDELHAILLDGAKFIDVCGYIAEKVANNEFPWQVPPECKPLSESSIRRLMSRAWDAVRADVRESRKKRMARHLGMRANLYARAVNAGDMRTALSILDSEAKLLDLFPTQRVDVTNATRMEIVEELVDANEKPCGAAALDAAAVPPQ